MRKKKFSLLACGASFVLLSSAFIGTTLAWFQDSAENSGNVLIAGNLDVDLVQYQDGQGYVSVDKKDPILDDSIQWEPGHSQVAYLGVSNIGDLAFTFDIVVDAADISSPDDDIHIVDALSYAVVNPYQVSSSSDYAESWFSLSSDENAKTGRLRLGRTESDNIGEVLPGETVYFAVAIHMDEESGNIYQLETAQLDLKINAWQSSYEEDGFGNSDYDGTSSSVPDSSVSSDISSTGSSSSESSESEPEPVLNALHLTSSSSSVTVGEKVTLSCVTDPVDYPANIVYTIISGSDYADLEGSVLTTKAKGTVTVQAEAEGIQSEPVSIEILAPRIESISDLKIGEDNTLTVGSAEEKISYQVEPAEAEGTISFRVSSGSDIVSVDSDGSVTALKAGKAVIEVLADGAVKGTLEITVVNPPIESIEIQAPSSLWVGQSAELSYSVSPSIADDDVVYQITADSDEGVLSLEDGSIKALKPGKAYVQAYSESSDVYSEKVEINVSYGDLTQATEESDINFYFLNRANGVNYSDVWMWGDFLNGSGVGFTMPAGSKDISGISFKELHIELGVTYNAFNNYDTWNENTSTVFRIDSVDQITGFKFMEAYNHGASTGDVKFKNGNDIYVSPVKDENGNYNFYILQKAGYGIPSTYQSFEELKNNLE